MPLTVLAPESSHDTSRTELGADRPQHGMRFDFPRGFSGVAR
jgi:hypothetical protein